MNVLSDGTKLCLHCLYYPMCKEISAGNCTAASVACSNFAAVQRWIPVAERVPEENQKVGIYTKSGSITLGWYTERHGLSYNKGFELECGFIWLGRVTHWMPLPEPPEKGE